MAIQQRRGAKADFDATKMLPGELAVTTDGSRKVYVAFAPGDAKELASTEDVEETIQSGIGEIEQKKEEALAQFPNYEDKLAELEIYKANSIISTSSGTVFHETDCAAVPPINIKLFGKSKQDGTPSMETPIDVVSHGESGSIVGKVLTSNFFDIESSKGFESIYGGINSVIDTNKIIITNIIATARTGYLDLGILSKGTYCITLTTTKSDGWGIAQGELNSDIKIFKTINNDNPKSFTIDSDTHIWIATVFGAGETHTFENIMLSKDVTREWEHFTEQPFTVLTPNGLRGIPLGQTIPDAIKNSPIHMSGVYWDTVEQRYYIGDTKNEDGKDVQRIGKDRLLASRLRILDSYCNEESNFFYISLSTNYLLQTNVDDYICDITKANLQQGVRDTENHGYLNMSSDGLFYIRLRKDSGISTLEEFKEYLTNNEVFIYIILKEPIITETDTQLDVVMNYPNTTIVNDEGAYMEVEYVADTQKHIEQNYVSKEAHQEHENRIAELEKAIVNS